jgi:probable HAF family extracellular repeat protein
MRLRSTVVIVLLLVASALGGGGAHRAGAAGGGPYTAVDLGSLGGDYSEAFAISDSGEVVGISMTTNDAQSHAFSWTKGAPMVDLGTLGGAWSTAAAVNDDGTVVGTSNLNGTALGQDPPYHAFAWTAATDKMLDLGTLGGNWSQGTAVNDSNVVVGLSVNGAGAQRAFRWTSGSPMSDLGTLGGSYAQAWAINDNGLIAGDSSIAGDTATHTFVWSPTSKMQDIGTLGGSYSRPTAINDDGQVVGVSNVSGDATRHAFSWTAAGGMVDLGTLGGPSSQATAVGNGGQVVGVSDVPGGGEHAFSWTAAGGMQDLGDLSGDGSYALGVDDNGRAVGGSGSGPQEHPVFWPGPGGATDLPTLGGVYGQPNAVNACGEVAGGSDLTGDQAEDATLWLPSSDFVGRCGAKLTLTDQPYRPLGINIYNANSRSNCWYDMVNGTTLDDSLTSIGSGANVIRAWFFQDLATTNGQRDWTAFDHTLAVARAHDVKVIATLGNQWPDCEPLAGYKNTAWYSGGYKQPDPGGTVSYRDWVQEVATRYRDDPTILAWQLLNEPEVLPAQGGDCGTVPESTAYNLLSSFAADVSAVIKRADPNHLVSLGTIGSGQCGAQSDDFTRLMEIPTLDLCEFHDYNQTDFVPGDQFNGLRTRINACNALRKPLLVGELGIIPNQVGGSLTDRANVIAGKLCAQLTAGIAGMLVWAWDKDGSTVNNYDIGPGDPALAALSAWSDLDRTCAPPDAPTGVVAGAGAESAAVSWLPPTSDGGAPVTSYTVTSNPGAVTKTVPGTSTSATVGPLLDGIAYTFTVTAANGAGTSPSSGASPSVTPQAGAVPPAAATTVASASSPTTLSTGSDPAATGGTSSTVIVPAGTAGGTVAVVQSATAGTTPPSGYLFGGVQADITAPAATMANPLTLIFDVAPPAGATLDTNTLAATDIYRTEAGGAPEPIPTCSGTGTPVDPEPACVSSRKYVTINGATYVQVSVSTESASRWNNARPAPSAVAVSNTGYKPTATTVAQGGVVTWAFNGGKPHSATDSVGLGPSGSSLFDSSAKTSGSYSYPFLAAGTYTYRSTVKGDSMTGTVGVPLVLGTVGANVLVIWAAAPMPGFVFDVSYRFKPTGSSKWGSWTAWKNGATAAAATFVPPSGRGTYSFHARLRNAATGRYSGDSADAMITVN